MDAGLNISLFQGVMTSLMAKIGLGLGPGHTSHFGRAESNSCIRRDQSATFDSIEYGSCDLGRPK